jgi:hypothetical protein
MRRLFSLFLVFALSLTLAACGEDDTTLDGTVTADTSTDGVAPDVGVPDMATDGTAPPAEYKFVKIEDLATVTGAQDGADIDAVELDKAGTSTWAASVASCTLPDGTDCKNSDKATGQADAFCDATLADLTKCFSNVESPTDDPTTIPPYTSLGGNDGTTSGTLVLQMSDKIENGDKLNIYELGNCDIATTCTDTSTSQATPESIKVSVGTSATGPWVEVLASSDTTNHPKVEITISGL